MRATESARSKIARNFYRLFNESGYIDILVVGTEFIAARLFPYVLPIWTASGPAGTDIKGLLLNVGGYLIGAQVGVLRVISIAIGLVTLIAQREGAGTSAFPSFCEIKESNGT